MWRLVRKQVCQRNDQHGQEGLIQSPLEQMSEGELQREAER